jgi:hypothetical protein
MRIDGFLKPCGGDRTDIEPCRGRRRVGVGIVSGCRGRTRSSIGIATTKSISSRRGAGMGSRIPLVMRIPRAEDAVIAPEKLRDYLLNPEHRRGATKARLLHAFGYRRDNWQQLEAELREQHLTQDAQQVAASEFGVRYEIRAPITTPSGRSLRMCSIWQIDTGSDVPRLITMFPE